MVWVFLLWIEKSRYGPDGHFEIRAGFEKKHFSSEIRSGWWFVGGVLRNHQKKHQVFECKSGWWLNHPSEKYARQIGNFPQIGVKIKNIWNHQQEIEI